MTFLLIFINTEFLSIIFNLNGGFYSMMTSRNRQYNGWINHILLISKDSARKCTKKIFHLEKEYKR